eukprot:TRINITY_DN214_c2_g1_i1.p1 TRINITY_DN214_c2_g1~~TRINITY_DN214_c2_g1_i1.p1  ORF type:complete len:250 (-),score=101.54 TRINITY_DN214_c2_g1_i1:170-919(-)
MSNNNNNSKFTNDLNSAEDHKVKGNDAFRKGELKKALKNYHFAHMYIRGVEQNGSKSGMGGMGGMGSILQQKQPKLSSEEEDRANELYISTFSNMAAVHLKLLEYKKCVNDCNKVLDRDENNVKALYRRGCAYLKIKDLDAAQEDLENIISIDPNNGSAKKQLKICKKAQKKYEENEKKRYQRMFKKQIQKNETNKPENNADDSIEQPEGQEKQIQQNNINNSEGNLSKNDDVNNEQEQKENNNDVDNE